MSAKSKIELYKKGFERNLSFFGNGTAKVFIASPKYAKEIKILKIKKTGLYRFNGLLVKPNNIESENYCIKNNFQLVTKEEFAEKERIILEKKIEYALLRKKEKSETRYNKKHGLGNYTDNELECIKIQVNTSADQSFFVDASKQKEWMKKTKRKNYLNKTEAEQTFYDCFTNEIIRKHFRIQHEIIIEGHTFYFDYYLRYKKVCVEIDGGYHKTAIQSKKDKERDEILLRNGIKTLRIKNEDAHIIFPREFCNHPFSVHKDRYEILIDSSSAGVVYIIMYHNKIIEQNSILKEKGDTIDFMCETLNLILTQMPNNAVVIVKCPRNAKLQSYINRSKYKAIFAETTNKFFEFDIMFLRSNNCMFKDIRKKINNLTFQKHQMILNKKKTEKLVDKTKMNVGTEKGGKVSKDIKSFFNSTDIVRVYINASAMKSEDKQTAATGIAYGIFPLIVANHDYLTLA